MSAVSEPGSVVARLRAQRERNSKPKRLTLEVPGWGGMLHVRYRPILWERMAEFLAVDAEDARAALESNADALAAACDEVMFADGAEKPRPLADALRSQGVEVSGPIRFDATLVEELALTVHDEATDLDRAPETSRETVLAVFRNAISPELAVTEASARLGAWMRGGAIEEHEALSGESHASPKSS